MLQLKNTTPFNTTCTPLTTLEGFDALAVFMSCSFYAYEGQWMLCERQEPTPFADQYWYEPGNSSIRYPSQLVMGKPYTDVIINGAVIAPNSSPVSSLDASVEFAKRSITVRAFGNRHWHRGRVTQPEPFTRMPIVWEKAYGGKDNMGKECSVCPDNPLGLGWRAEELPLSDYQDTPLPNIEWPHQLICSPGQRPKPAGFSAVSVNSPTRVKLAGTWDAEWQAQRAPFMPADFNPAFFNAAIPELQVEKGWGCGEEVHLKNLNKQSDLIFTLPMLKPIAEAQYAKSRKHSEFDLLTIVIETEVLIVKMFWQAIFAFERTFSEIKIVKISLSGN